MTSSESTAPGREIHARGGELGTLIRDLDWSRTPLGPMQSWSRSLRTSIDTCLGCSFPIVLWWGPDLCIVYNDEYRSILGPAKHPSALGSAGRTVWAEIWDTVGPMLRQVMERGEATRSRDLFLPIVRSGYGEEAYFSFSYSPIHDDDGRIGGVFCPVIETTDRVIGERRLRTLRDLAAACRGVATEDLVLQSAARVLTENGHDVPFALLYRLDNADAAAALVATAGAAAGSAVAPRSVAIGRRETARAEGWPAQRVDPAAGGDVRDVVTPPGDVPTGAWSEPPRRVKICPIRVAGRDEPVAMLVAAVSPMRALDDGYTTFLDLVASQIGAGLTDARVLAEERHRAEALAEIDRVKTMFFSNVSHEFRTPLTLMLGPLEEALASPDGLSADMRTRIEVAHRNSLRLLRLVNTLLDFSRIEAGRARADFEPTDLGSVTVDLASSFRSACEAAGLELIVECERLAEPIHVDRDMWEKIVLNLVSNAFKFTLRGSIVVRLVQRGDDVVLTVADTGVGIPPDDLPRMFERFHRVERTRGRTHEGSGIGLALVKELVRLHGGTTHVDSELGRGSCFTVTVPFGTAHLDPRQVRRDGAAPSGRTPTGAPAFVEEARRWLPDGATDRRTPSKRLAKHAPRVVLADDNADLRDYMTRLLADRFDVHAFADGAQALAACIARPPDVVVADVMMPVLDGLGLVRALRANPTTAGVPVLLLSARAGEESRIEGIATGADDYVVKPFHAAELVSRIENQAQLGRIRKEPHGVVRADGDPERGGGGSPVLSWVTDADGEYTYVSDSWYEFTGMPVGTGLGDGWFDAVHPDDREWARRSVHAAAAARRELQLEYRIRRADGEYRWVIDAAVPRVPVGGCRGAVIDITDRKRAELELGSRTLQYQTLLTQAPLGVFVVDADLRVRDVNPVALAAFGEAAGNVVGADFASLLHLMWRKAFADDVVRIFRRVLETGTPHVTAELAEYRVDRRRTEYYEWRLHRIPIPDGRYGLVCYFRDLSAQVSARLVVAEALAREQSARALAENASKVKDEFLATLSHELRTPLNAILGWSRLLKIDLGDAERARHAVDVIERNGRQQARLISDILDMSRVISGQLRLDLVEVDLRRIVGEALEAMRPVADAKGVHLSSTTTELSGAVRGDSARLQQVVSNLLANAVKFTPSGGHVDVVVENAADHARIRVTDDGEGIPAQFLPTAFDRFTQADSSTTRRHGGLGIGLALVKELVSLHGGRVTANSAGPSLGSTFVVELPWAPAAEAGSRMDVDGGAANPTVSLRGIDVLVVDDEPDARALVRRILESSSASVTTCASAEEAMRLLPNGRFHVLVSDIGMPGRDGYELIREVRERGAQIPAIALTAYSQPEDRERALRAGYQAHLTKPLAAPQLIAAIAALTPRVRS